MNELDDIINEWVKEKNILEAEYKEKMDKLNIKYFKLAFAAIQKEIDNKTVTLPE